MSFARGSLAVARRPTPAVVCLLVGNLLDALTTMALLELGLARETNPLMRLAYEASPLVFMLGKLAMVQGAVLLVARLDAPFRVVSRAGAAMYGLVVAYQAAFVLSLA